MYIRGLILRNFADLAAAVPMVLASIHSIYELLVFDPGFVVNTYGEKDRELVALLYPFPL